LHKKLVAALTIAIFVLSSVAIIAPASAHFTLGDLTPNYRFHANDYDPHVAGPLMYVSPGAGAGAFSGPYSGGPVGLFPPGYQSPNPGGNPPGQQASVYQLDGNTYAPFGAILTSTADHPNTGPLVFAINFSDPAAFSYINAAGAAAPWAGMLGYCSTGFSYCANYTGITIYIPPEFDLSAAASNPGLVQSTIGATANDVVVSQVSNWDAFGPGWWQVTVTGDIHFWPQHNYQEWYYLKINNVVAPTTAGKYFFKAFLLDQYFNNNWPGMARTYATNGFQCDPNDLTAACWTGPLPNNPLYIPTSGATNATVPVENYPVLLVKGDIDPGIITGTVRYGTFNQTLYQQPINFPGKVWAVGTAIDPYKPDHPSTGRNVTAMGYFNASAQGHFEVEGVAAGVYDIYAEAAGYPAQLVASQVTILPGQSFHLDIYLNPGPVVNGQIYSKHLFGEEPWPSNPRPVYVELYGANDYASSSVRAFSPLNLTTPPFMAYDWDLNQGAPHGGQFTSTNIPPCETAPSGPFNGHDASGCPTPRPVAYPWFAVNAAWGGSYYSQFFPPTALAATYALANHHDAVQCGGTNDLCGKQNGVGPAQYWWVDGAGAFTNGGGANSFIYRFGVKGVYGAPTDFDGHVPQALATWVNGLTPGRYWVRAWINGYTQTLQDGQTLDEYYFDVAKDEWAGDVFMPMDLRISSTINKTVHFHDLPGTLQDCAVDGCINSAGQNTKHGLANGARFLIAEVRDSSGKLWGMNFTRVFGTDENMTIQINGFGMMGPDAFGLKYSDFVYAGYRDYGLPAGTYTVYTYMRGYVQQTFESVSVTLSGNAAQISNHLYRGAILNMTIWSIDWEHPTTSRPWEFPGSRFRTYLFDQNGKRYGPIGDVATAQASAPRQTGPARGDDPRRQPLPGAASGNCGGGVACAWTDTEGQALIYTEWDGAIAADRRGPDIITSFYEQVGGNLELEAYGIGFLSIPTLYRDSATPFATRIGLETGTYTAFSFTPGYVQHQEFSVYAPKGGVGDIRVNLLRGVNVTLNIPFKKEGIFTPTDFNMTMRVRLFDDAGNLVATQSSAAPDNENLNSENDPIGRGRYAYSPNAAIVSAYYSYYVDPFSPSPDIGNGLKSVDASSANGDGFLWFGDYYGSSTPGVKVWQGFDSNQGQASQAWPSFYNIQWNGCPSDVPACIPTGAYWGNFQWYGAIPAGTEQVRVSMMGMYDIFGDPLDGLNAGVLHTKAWDGSSGEKIDSMLYGIDGFSSTIPSSYSGGWTAEVDTVNLYPKPQFAANGFPLATNWFPAAEGLLEGDSFHTIPGSPAGPFGYTTDTLSANGLGPYAQRQVWSIPNAHLGAEASAIYELDKRGYISGNVYGFTWANDFRTQSWNTIQFASATGNQTFSTWTRDGFYDAYLDAGQYNMQVIAWTPSGNQGFTTVSQSLTISSGQSSSGVSFQLERSNIPVPEFTSIAVVAFSALAASLYVLRRRRK